jgi:3-phenylpropionate/trans-cinnamate dioxygenase ferredoxin reductase subunit
VHGRRLRVEHWEVAAAQGRHAARAMLGAPDPYTEVPYFWTDLSDWATAEYVGPAARWDQEVVRGSFDDGAFTVFYLDGGQVVAALTVGRSGDLDLARRLMTSGEDVSDRTDALADPDGES